MDLEAGVLGDREGLGDLVANGDEGEGIRIVGAGCPGVVVEWVVVGREGEMGLMGLLLLVGMGMNGVRLEDLLEIGIGIGIGIGTGIEGGGGKVSDVTLLICLFNAGMSYDESSTASMLRTQV